MRYDIFCKVVDNFGDAGVCWRLAWQLVNEKQHAVRLWLDQPEALAALRPELVRHASSQKLDGVEVQHWTSDCLLDDPGDVVVEGFGCGLPEHLLAAMLRRSPASLWIVLEYLSAEAWVDDCHGLPSPHPALPLQRYYFFPGFSLHTGGLIRASALNEHRNAFRSNPDASSLFWRDLGFSLPATDAVTVSLFGYENPRLEPLLAVWIEGEASVVVAVPPGRLRDSCCRFFGKESQPDGSILRRGSLEVRFIPFLSQDRYDELLWACDWNFVRGEDSFVRAQWAGMPFVWQIYVQEDAVHHAKLEAFLQRYLEGLGPAAATALAGFWRAWNGIEPFQQMPWNALQAHSAELRMHAVAWAQRRSEMPDLVSNLANFCAERIKSPV